MIDDYRVSNELMLFKLWGWESGNDWTYVAARGWKDLVEYLGDDMENIKRVEDVGHLVEVAHEVS